MKSDPNNPVIYIPNFLSSEMANSFLSMMLSVDWEKRPDAPRQEHWSNDFDQSYTYGKGAGVRTYMARPMPYAVSRVREEIFDLIGVYHQGCFCNRYDGQRDWLGWHSDDDPGIDHGDPISVVTLGHPRALQYRPMGGRLGVVSLERSLEEQVGEVMLDHGSLLIMRPGMQSTHQHRIPKVGHSVSTRVSLTYRSMRR